MSEAQHQCIHCGSTDLVFSDDKQGFGAGKAVVGALVLGPLGLLAGAAGRNKRHVNIRCNACLKFFTGDELRAQTRRAAPGGCLTVIGVIVLVCFVIAIGEATCSPKNTAPAPAATKEEPTATSAPDMAKPAREKRTRKKPAREER